MKVAFALFIIFVCGVNFANNLSDLVETNPVWQAAWWKVWVSLVIALYFSIVVYTTNET